MNIELASAHAHVDLFMTSYVLSSTILHPLIIAIVILLVDRRAIDLK